MLYWLAYIQAFMRAWDKKSIVSAPENIKSAQVIPFRRAA